MKSCVIFAGGEQVSKNCVDFDETENSLVISADRGFLLAEKFGIKSDIIIGDFDSLGAVPEFDSEVITFPPEKDDTDLMLAVKEGLKAGCKTFTLYGCMGGRFDHTLGNIQTLAYLIEKGATGKIISDSEVIQLVPSGNYKIKKRENFSLSLLSYSEQVTGLTIRGTEYTLDNGTVCNSFPIGISNKISEDYAEISFNSGKLLIIQSDLLTKIS